MKSSEEGLGYRGRVLPVREVPDRRDEHPFVSFREAGFLPLRPCGQVASIRRAVDEERGHRDFWRRLGVKLLLGLGVGATA